MKNLFAFIALCLLCITCKNDPIIIPEFMTPETDRVVIVEEFTGVRCPNCPKGQRELENLQLRFPGKIVVVGMHSFFLANPLPESKYDFRTLDAEFLNRYLGIAGSKPSAVVNRTTFDVIGVDGIFNGQVDTWAGVIESELEVFSKIEITQEVEFDPNTRSIDVTATVVPKEDINTPLYINVMVTESELEDPQEDNGIEIEEYVHNHVLREIITDVEGGDEFAPSLGQGESMTKNYSYTFVEKPDEPAWNPAHIDVVVFITTDVGGERRALQASVKKILE